MFLWIRRLRNLIVPRKVVFRWKSNLREDEIKLYFRGDLRMAMERDNALEFILSSFEESEVLESLDFVGIDV